MKVIQQLQVGALLAILLIAYSADAQVVQVPGISGFGNDNNLYPFSASSSMRYQQIYASTAFSHGGVIDKIMFRYDEQFGQSYGPAGIDVQVAVAYAANGPESASPTFADNIGDDFSIVFDGMVTGSDDSAPPTLSFEFVLDVANTFTYDPNRGNLLLQILKRDTNELGTFDASSDTQQSVMTRIWARDVNAATGVVGYDSADSGLFGLVTQFQLVPEPSAIQFAAVSLLLNSSRRRKRHP